MKKVSITVDEKVWARVRVEALESGRTTGEVLSEAFSRVPESKVKFTNGSEVKFGFNGPDDEPYVSETEYVPSYSDGNIKPTPKELSKEEKIETLKAMMPKSDYFNPDPKKGKK